VLSGRPLYDNEADRRVFAVPRAWNELVRAIERRLNVLLLAERGAGKTSVLRQLQMALREQGESVVFVDATAVGDPLELSYRIRDALLGQQAPLRGEPDPVAAASRTLAANLRDLADSEPTVLLVDASGSADAIYGLFGRLRDTLWQLEHRWVVAADSHDRPTVLKSPADAFFDVVISLGPWSTNELVDLISHRLDDEDDVAQQTLIEAATAARGIPREALRALNAAIVHNRDPAQTLSQRARLIEKASKRGRPHGMLMAELLDRGQASPSDAELQATLGISRPRLTQLFRDLLAEKLVVGAPERSDRPGRPRTVYRPVLPDDDF
jgi:AAA domain-containing protein